MADIYKVVTQSNKAKEKTQDIETGAGEIIISAWKYSRINVHLKEVKRTNPNI